MIDVDEARSRHVVRREVSAPLNVKSVHRDSIQAQERSPLRRLRRNLQLCRSPRDPPQPGQPRASGRGALLYVAELPSSHSMCQVMAKESAGDRVSQHGLSVSESLASDSRFPRSQTPRNASLAHADRQTIPSHISPSDRNDHRPWHSNLCQGIQESFFELSKAFCLCRLFQFSVLEIESTQSSLFRSNGRTLGKGKRLADTVT